MADMTCTRRALQPLALACWVTAVSVAAAQAADAPVAADFGAALPALVEWVDHGNPELAAMRHEADAADARVEPAGALADPMFQLELRDISRSDPGLLPARAGSTKYTISQQIPWWGKRDLRRQVAQADADAAQARTRQVRAELHAKVKTAYAQHYAAVEAARQTEAIAGLLRDLEKVALARYGAGLVPQQDAIKAQLEQTALRGELIRLAAEAGQARARLNAALGRPGQAPLAAPQELGAMPQRPLDAGELSERALAANPQLAVQAAQVAGAERGRELAGRNWYPDFNIGVSPVQRGERLDGWEAMVEVNIPLQRGTRRAQEREAAAMLASAQARRQAVSSQLLGELGEAVAGFNAALDSQRLLADAQLPQAELNFRSALAAYESGKVDFATLLDAQRQIRAARLELVRAQVDARMRLADIERILGEP